MRRSVELRLVRVRVPGCPLDFLVVPHFFFDLVCECGGQRSPISRIKTDLPSRKHPLKMECGVTGGYTNGTTPAGILADVRSERSPSKTGLHVNFKEKGEIKEKREKFLTAKYGHHQMSLIRKRLAVEMWLYEELKKLYENKTTKQVDDVNNDEVEVDIDELLDMDSDEERRRHLQDLLINAKGSQSDVKKFINDLLDKAKTL